MAVYAAPIIIIDVVRRHRQIHDLLPSREQLIYSLGLLAEPLAYMAARVACSK